VPLVGLQAARIFTGAKVPVGADAVVMQEDVKRTGSTIRIDQRPKPGLNIRRAGSEMGAGDHGSGTRVGVLTRARLPPVLLPGQDSDCAQAIARGASGDRG
jgi:molybdopterin biosynthesis enzyme